MKPISYARHRFPPDVIRQAVWLYFRFTMSFRDVEDLMAERGIEVSYETIRCWTLKFGTLFARTLRRARSSPTGRWHLDEMVVRIGGQRMYLWRAVDDEGEVLDMLVQKRRNKAAARKLLRKLLKNQGVHPESIVTDGLTSARIVTGQAACGRTIGRRTPTCRSGDGSESSRSSNPKVPPRGSSPRTPPSTTPSTSSAI